MKLENYLLNGVKNIPISEKFESGELKIVLLDYKGIPSTSESQRNLLAIDEHYNIVWIAEVRSSLFSSYFAMKIENDKLYALTDSYWCEIDLKEGKIMDEEFTRLY